MIAAMHLLCRSITTDEDDAPDLGPWHKVEASSIDAAATRFAADHQAHVVLVRGLAVEQVFAFHLCEAYCEDAESDPNHPAATADLDCGWLPCKHCDAWVEYDYGDGFWEAVEDALGHASAPSPAPNPAQLPLPGATR